MRFTSALDPECSITGIEAWVVEPAIASAPTHLEKVQVLLEKMGGCEFSE